MGIRRYVLKIIDMASMAMITAMGAMIFAQVIARYVFGRPLTWPEELSRLLLIWTTYLGAYAAMRGEQHLALTFMIDRLKPGPKAAMAVISDALVAVFLGIVTTCGLPFLTSMRNARMPVTGIPMSVCYGVVWLASLLMLVETLIRLISHVRETARIHGGGKTR